MFLILLEIITLMITDGQFLLGTSSSSYKNGCSLGWDGNCLCGWLIANTLASASIALWRRAIGCIGRDMFGSVVIVMLLVISSFFDIRQSITLVVIAMGMVRNGVCDCASNSDFWCVFLDYFCLIVFAVCKTSLERWLEAISSASDTTKAVICIAAMVTS